MEQRLIDANALAKRMQYLIRMRVYDTFDCLNEIDAAPTIEAEPVKHGWWEWMEDMYGAYVRCSECGDEFNCWEADCALTKYCPNCGAKMDEEDE